MPLYEASADEQPRPIKVDEVFQNTARLNKALSDPPQPQSPLAQADAEIAERIRAARVATYCGRGISAQVPWVTPVLDLFRWLQWCIYCFSCTRMRFIVAHIEHDERAARAARRNFPQAVHVWSVETFNAAGLRPVLQKQNFAFILIGGGAPCQRELPVEHAPKRSVGPPDESS